jgi:hypothetical protein
VDLAGGVMERGGRGYTLNVYYQYVGLHPTVFLAIYYMLTYVYIRRIHTCNVCLAINYIYIYHLYGIRLMDRIYVCSDHTHAS